LTVAIDRAAIARPAAADQRGERADHEPVSERCDFPSAQTRLCGGARLPIGTGTVSKSAAIWIRLVPSTPAGDVGRPLDCPRISAPSEANTWASPGSGTHGAVPSPIDSAGEPKLRSRKSSRRAVRAHGVASGTASAPARAGRHADAAPVRQTGKPSATPAAGPFYQVATNGLRATDRRCAPASPAAPVAAGSRLWPAGATEQRRRRCFVRAQHPGIACFRPCLGEFGVRSAPPSQQRHDQIRTHRCKNRTPQHRSGGGPCTSIIGTVDR
jgi:hypothetical protein